MKNRQEERSDVLEEENFDWIAQGSTPGPESLEIHIEELVLHGFPQGHRHRIGEALKTELTTLLGNGGVPQKWKRTSDLLQLDGGTFTMESREKPEAIGVQIAQAVVDGLKR